MSMRLATLTLLVVAAVGLGSAARAQQCPDPCSPSLVLFSSSGALLPGDTILFTPANPIQGTGALLGVIGGGVVCHTCKQCAQRFLISWDIQSTKDLFYNNCGQVELDGGTSHDNYGLWANCGQFVDFELDYGDQSAPGCAGGQPEIPNPDWTATWRLTCTSCQ